jgi:uncharacterized phage protein (TIGR02220 family)
MKEVYYFSHDSNAHRDPKCSALISDFGSAGYGLYWAIVEILHEQGGKIEKFPKLFEGLSFQFQTPKEAVMKQIEAMIKDYKLLKEDENYIWSDRVLRNLEQRRVKYQVKSEAGRIGGLRSGEKRRTKQNEAVLEANERIEAKERKGKESKVKEREIEDFFSYYTLKTKKNFRLTSTNHSLIKNRLEEGYTPDQLKKAVDNFMLDDWPERAKRLDLIYCIGKQKDKPDNLEKWLNYKPAPKFIKP